MRITVSVVAAVCATTAALAQETPTQRDAARDVVAKMAALQREIDAPAWAAKLTAPNAARDAVAARAKALMDAELLALSDDITRHPRSASRKRALSSCSSTISRRTTSR